MCEFKKMEGKTIILVKGAEKHSDCIVFFFNDGTAMKMFHEQDCCESVQVEDVCGDINDLIDQVVISAEEATSCENPPPDEVFVDDSFTWTFYHIRTNAGTVTIRWFGTSNGYYSESVDCEMITSNGAS